MSKTTPTLIAMAFVVLAATTVALATDNNATSTSAGPPDNYNVRATNQIGMLFGDSSKVDIACPAGDNRDVPDIAIPSGGSTTTSYLASVITRQETSGVPTIVGYPANLQATPACTMEASQREATLFKQGLASDVPNKVNANVEQIATSFATPGD